MRRSVLLLAGLAVVAQWLVPRGLPPLEKKIAAE